MKDVRSWFEKAKADYNMVKGSASKIKKGVVALKEAHSANMVKLKKRKDAIITKAKEHLKIKQKVASLQRMRKTASSVPRKSVRTVKRHYNTHIKPKRILRKKQPIRTL